MNIAILMSVFGLLILLCGIYLYTGHKNELLLWKVHDIKNFPMSEVKKIGFWTMITSLIPFLIALLSIIFGWGD